MTDYSTHHTANNNHGSIRPYVIGFVLSLIFTIIPYYLVTRQVMSGTTMLIIILGLAIVQMFVQIVFFLHLGRGPKPLYNIVFFGATAGLIVLVVGASILIMSNLYHNMSPQEMTTKLAQEENIAEINGLQTGACQGNNANHIVTIKDNVVTPQFTEAQRCDTLTISIQDGVEREVIFRRDNTPVSYGGEQEISVRSDRSKIITLNEVGTFIFLDASNEATAGSFTVSP